MTLNWYIYLDELHISSMMSCDESVTSYECHLILFKNNMHLILYTLEIIFLFYP